MSGLTESANEVLKLGVVSFGASFSYLSYAVGKAEPSVTEEKPFCYTDGKGIYFGEKQLLFQTAARGAELIVLGLCHTVLHDLFLHPFKADGKDALLYDTACDVTVAYYTDELNVPFGDRRNIEYRKRLYKSIIDKFGGVTESFCSAYLKEKSKEELEQISTVFKVCDHFKWRRSSGGEGGGSGDNDKQDDDGENKNAEKQWIEISKIILPKLGKDQRELSRKLENIVGGKRDYRKLLERFIKSSERKTPSEDFDYIFYCYGLSLYKNVPLIERLETSDAKDYSQVVVAIDVSGSTAGEPVEIFLKEVYSICSQISEKDKLRLRIIQCDNEIRSDEIINGDEDFKNKMKEFKLKGGGGTDFRPVFDRLAADKKRGAKIRALLYFTDGYGTFPTENPDFKVCFLLYGENAEDMKVPYFAYKIVLGDDDLSCPAVSPANKKEEL